MSGGVDVGILGDAAELCALVSSALMTWLAQAAQSFDCHVRAIETSQQVQLQLFVFGVSLLVVFLISLIRRLDTGASGASQLIDMSTDVGAASIVLGATTLVAVMQFQIQPFNDGNSDVWSALLTLSGGLVIYQARKRARTLSADLPHDIRSCRIIFAAALVAYGLCSYYAVQCLAEALQAQKQGAKNHACAYHTADGAGHRSGLSAVGPTKWRLGAD